MNYLKIYNQFIKNRKLKDPIRYVEKHHIVPKSLGGLDDESNIIKLSASDHLFTHGLLARVYKGKMIFALKRMLYGQQKRYTSKSERSHYEFVKSNLKHSIESKSKMSKAHSGKKLSNVTKRKISDFQKDKIFTDETKRKISQSLIGNQCAKGAVRSDKTKAKMSEAKKGITFSEEHKDNLSKSLKGRVSPRKGKILSNETKLKMSKSLRGRTAWNKGKKGVSDETRNKMSEAAKNRKN
jgi:hypothetical protein